jgi:hypothetical protein
MTVGQVLTLIAYNNIVIHRRLVAVENGLLFVCKDEEFKAARREAVIRSVSVSGRNTWLNQKW